MGGDGSVARVWVGVDRRWGGCSGGRRAGWLLVRSGWTSGWIETPGDGCDGRERVSQREEVARLFVCQPRWDPLPILSHSSATTPARSALFPFNHPRRTLRTGTTSTNVSVWFGVYVYVCVYASTDIYVCVCVCVTYVWVKRARAPMYVAPMYYTLQTSPPYTRSYPMCRICS